MDERYDAYCAVDPLFYDSLATTSRSGQFAAAQRPLPDGWTCETSEDWIVYGPEGTSLPAQGWKIHISACLDNAERVLDRVYDYCMSRGLSFKFIRSPLMLLMRNSKYASRESSGKFITIYPPQDEADLELVCKELAELLDGEPGPYILSDLRYGAGPVYIRYGGFAARYCHSPDGKLVPAIENPDGVLVPDERGPVFRVPEWVTLPDFLAPHLAARNAVTTKDLPYEIERVIHFSNGGGLYAGRDTRTGTPVVLKEARPHAGLDAAGTDAVTRLRREAEVLRRLSDIPQVPRVHEEFTLGDHQFLALEFIEGRPLNRVLVERYPLIELDAPSERFAEYTSWALHIYEQVEQAINAIHERGVVYGDLHLFNIMVRPDDTIALVDFEVAAPFGEHRHPALRSQGFAAPRERSGAAIDRYALACLRLALFLPLTEVLRLAPAKAMHFAEIIAEHFPVPRSFLDEAVAEITGVPSTPIAASDTKPTPVIPPIDDWPTFRSHLASGITASATPYREDRLFPGDIEQFRTGGLNLAYGAAGVLYALAVTGAGRHPEYEEWLVKRALTPPPGTSWGFWDGLHGVAYTLELLGRREEALAVLDRCLAEPWEKSGLDLIGGLPGIALNFAEFAQRTGDPAFRDAAWRAAELVAGQIATDTDATISGGKHRYAGLARGRTGPALMFLRLYELTGDTALLEHAATALRQDLRRCVVRPDGTMEVNEGWRTMPYLAAGSVGIGLVLDQYLQHRDDEQFRETAGAIRRAARAPFYIQSGLFAGRAGIIVYLASRVANAGDTADEEDRRELAAQVRRLAWHAVPYRGVVAFPGEQLLRLSMDLATGGAGVLLAVGAALHDTPVTLPFFAPLSGAHKLPSRPRG
ncbi:MAG TPA: class III lanthionine synthetase LanKC [Micromonospora sp.]